MPIYCSVTLNLLTLVEADEARACYLLRVALRLDDNRTDNGVTENKETFVNYYGHIFGPNVLGTQDQPRHFYGCEWVQPHRVCP